MKSWTQFLFAILVIGFTISTFANNLEHHSGYSRIIVFGDSLSDVGTYAVFAGLRGGGKFTTNPGKIWVEIVAEKLGLPMMPNRQEGFGVPLREIGGFNYAQGGSRIVIPHNQTAQEVETLTARPLTEQLGLFLSKYSRFNEDDLVLIQGGANDILTQLREIGQNGKTPAEAIQNSVQAGLDLATIMANMKDHGAEKIFVINLPAIEKTPRVLTLDADAQRLAASMVAAFNQTLAIKSFELGIRVIDFYQFDINFNDQATGLGFSDITHPACKADRYSFGSALFCSLSSLVEPGADLKFKYADEMHPTTGFSKQAGEFIYNQITSLRGSIQF